MSTMIQIRNVPTEIHRQAKARAALAGMTLSDFALRALERQVREPTLAELSARIHELEAVEVSPQVADIVRAERDAR